MVYSAHSDWYAKPQNEVLVPVFTSSIPTRSSQDDCARFSELFLRKSDESSNFLFKSPPFFRYMAPLLQQYELNWLMLIKISSFCFSSYMTYGIAIAVLTQITFKLLIFVRKTWPKLTKNCRNFLTWKRRIIYRRKSHSIITT